jgi:carboxyl-terminal processing protease
MRCGLPFMTLPWWHDAAKLVAVPERGTVTSSPDFLHVVVPPCPELDGFAELIDHERAGMEAEFGLPVLVTRSDPGTGRRWVFRLDPEHTGPAALYASGDVLESVSADPVQLAETASLRHTWLRTGRPVKAEPAADLAAGVRRIADEIEFTFPGFELRGIDWAQVCQRHMRRVLESNDPFSAAQEWVAVLGDAHTALHPHPRPVRPASVCAARNGEAVLQRVLPGTAAWEAGIRPGWRLDLAAAEVDAILASTAAPPRSVPYFAGRRLLAVPHGERRTWRAIGPGGQTASWSEIGGHAVQERALSWRNLESGAGYVRLAGFPDGAGLREKFDQALTELADCRTLIIDVRGNAGGNYLLALGLRDRFVPAGTLMGSVRHSIGRRLSDPVPLLSSPTDAVRWQGRVIVLTDPQVASSGEDFLLGLAGLDHVLVVGEPSAGVSGRPRFLEVLHGWGLMVSTALTYDRDGRCIEGAGIPVDVEVQVYPYSELPDGQDRVLAAAQALTGRDRRRG